jgi:hypothetical protein
VSCFWSSLFCPPSPPLPPPASLRRYDWRLLAHVGDVIGYRTTHTHKHTGCSISLCDGKVKVVQEALDACENRAHSCPAANPGGEEYSRVKGERDDAEARAQALKAETVSLKVELLEMRAIQSENAELRSKLQTLEQSIKAFQLDMGSKDVALKHALAEVHHETHKNAALSTELSGLQASVQAATTCTQLESELDALRAKEADVSAKSISLEAESQQCAR